MRDSHRRSILRLALALCLGLGLPFALVRSLAACSCMQPQPMAAYAGDETVAVFTGIVERRDERGFPATVTRWFQGGGILDSRVWFDVGGFNVQPGVVNTCAIDPLPAGGEWLFVAYRIEGSNSLGMGLCSPHAQIASADGKAMLADALSTFGAATLAPTATNPPPTGGSSPGSGVIGAAVPILIALVAAAGVVLGVVTVVGRRRDPGSGQDDA